MATLKSTFGLCQSSKKTLRLRSSTRLSAYQSQRWQSSTPLTPDSSQPGPAFEDGFYPVAEPVRKAVEGSSRELNLRKNHVKGSSQAKQDRNESRKVVQKKPVWIQKDGAKSNVSEADKGTNGYWIEVRFDRTNRTRCYNSIFLRDSCTCPKCVDPSTRQKLFSTADIPGNIQAVKVWQDDHHLNLTWKHDVPGYEDDHTTQLHLRFLSRSVFHPPVSPYTSGRTLWDAEDFAATRTTLDYNEYMSSDSTLLQALDHLHQYGLIFLNNVPEAESSVSDIANRIGPLKNTFYGQTWDVRSVPDAKNVAYTSQDLGFHMDLLYMQQPPRLQLLHCLKASDTGGTSLFSDSYNAAQKLYTVNEPNFRALVEEDINFHYDNDSQHYHQTRRVIEFDDTPSVKADGTSRRDIAHRIKAVNWSPPFQGPFHDTGGYVQLSQHVRRWHKAARSFRGFTDSEQAVYARQMPPGECVIFDNQRVLHARTAFSGGERWLRGCYVDSDPFFSKTRVLRARQAAKKLNT